MLFGLLRIMWCYMKSGLHDATFLDLTYFMLRCFTLPTSCQAAWCRQNLCMLFEVVVMMLSWWIFSLPHAMLPDPSYIMPICFIFPISCFPAWSCFHDATLLDIIYFMLRCFTLPMSYNAAWYFCLNIWICLHIAMLLDHLYLMPHCLTLNCYIVLFALPSANHGFSAWSCLHGVYAAWCYLLHAALLHTLYLMSNCFMPPI